MNRRTFLTQPIEGTISAGGGVRPVARGSNRHEVGYRRNSGQQVRSVSSDSDLTPYEPRPDKPWDARRIGHLLRRTGFGVTRADIETLASASPTDAVEAMLADTPQPDPPGSWVAEPPFPVLDNSAYASYRAWAYHMLDWWVERMRTPETALREKMVLFWHNHFVSQISVVVVTQHMYQQNQLFRRFAFGDFRELTKQVTIDPAMLRYLDGALSRAGNPNENYARELLELFTIGDGAYNDGTRHYTEKDIVELSRALTGWTISGLNAEFKPARFDPGAKTIFGRSRNFGIDGHVEENVIDWIFEQTDPDRQEKRAAVFLCEKLYRYFVAPIPNPNIIKGMAAMLTAENWNLKPVLRQLFTSEHFFDDNVIGSLIKSPVDFAVGAIREFGLEPPSDKNYSAARPETHDPIIAMSFLAQTLMEPPNVKGWPGGRNWISSVTLPLRVRYSKMWVEPVSGGLPYNFDPSAFLNSLPDRTDPSAVINAMIEQLLPIDVSQKIRDRLLDTLLGGGYDWDPDHPAATQRIRSTLVQLTNLSEYQLL